MERVSDLLEATPFKPKSVDWAAFHKDVESMPGLRRIYTDRWTYRYSVEETRMNTDPFVRKSMKLWNTEQYKSLYGKTKRADLEVGLDAFKKFGRYTKTWSRVSPEVRAAYFDALARARHVFTPREPLHRLSVPNVCDQMNLDSSAGFSFPGKKKSEVIEQVFDTASYIAHFVSAGKSVYIPPAKLALRGHLSDADSNKTRPVWVFPAEVTVLEGKWALPYYKFLEEEVPAVHFGEGAMQRLAKMMMSDVASHSECAEVTLGWSGFDSSVPNFMIDDAFSILFDAFDETSVLHDDQLVYGGEYMASKNYAVRDWLVTYFKKTKMMLPDGSVYNKFCGVPSGSFFTQAIGSIVNWIANTTLGTLLGLTIQRLRVLGDDSTFLIPNGRGKVNGPAIAKAAWEAFGFTLKLEKLRIALNQSQRKFLGYSVSAYRYERPTEDWFSMVLYPERDVEFLEQSASRVLAFYLLGGCNDPAYCDFFRDYLGRYPVIHGRTLPLTKGLKRLFKFVLRYPVDSLVFPDFSRFDLLKVPFALSLGDRPFG